MGFLEHSFEICVSLQRSSFQITVLLLTLALESVDGFGQVAGTRKL